jgi:hypothetical protein
MTKKPKKGDALSELLSTASHEVLSKLIVRLAAQHPDVRRECFDFLKSRVSVSKALVQRSEGEAVLALWYELAPDLEELDDYGGGDFATRDHVAELSYQIQKRLDSGMVDADCRQEILDLTLPFIESSNAGLDDNYLSGLGKLDRNAERKEYARNAMIMVKVRHILVDVLGDKDRWEKFAGKIKRDNLRRPAFQQEFTRVVPGWRLV